MSELWMDTHVEIHQHSYWSPISSFVLSEDTYPHWSIFCVEDGILGYQVMGQKGQARFGDIIFCPPYIPLKREVIEELRFHFLQFSFKNIENSPLPVGKVQLNDTIRLQSTYSHLQAVAFNESLHSNKWKGHLIYDLLQIYSMENQLVTIDDQPKITDSIISLAIQYLHEHAFAEISIRDLSSIFALSPVQFTRRFQASVGTTPIDYLTSLRLRKARTLLLETDYTIDNIAAQCGYNNGFYFSRIFSKKMQMSPSMFRRTHKI
jgi:AraC family transcriptional regulator